LSACTTSRPVVLPPSNTYGKLPDNLAWVGDRVKVTTTDGKVHKFGVTSVSDTLIEGKRITIPKEDIILIEKIEGYTLLEYILITSMGIVFYPPFLLSFIVR
jgi:hypothetical protein